MSEEIVLKHEGQGDWRNSWSSPVPTILFASDVLDEAAIIELDAAASDSEFDSDLLRSAPARDIRIHVEAVVALLRKIDQRVLLSRQGLVARLTGADVEARLEFELAGQAVLEALNPLRRAALNGRGMLTLLRQTRTQLIEHQPRLEHVIEAAKRLIECNQDADDFIIARFERRLSNLVAMHTANVATIEQIKLSEQVLASLLDRVTDVDTLIVPLWQRNLLALAHAATSGARSHAASEFSRTHNNLITHLTEETGK